MRGKTMFLRLFLTLLLMAGLTVDFHTMSLGFGTAAYACSDDDDWGDDDGWDECVYDSHDFAADYYTDIDGDYNPWDGDNPFTPEIEEGRDYTDDDDDCTFCDMHTVDDFIYYIESGEAGRDGIDGHVWNDNYNGHAYDEHDLLGDVENSEGNNGGEPNFDPADDTSVSQNQESVPNTEDDDGGKRPEGWGIHGTIAEGKVIDDIVVNGHKDDNNDNDDKDRQPDFGHFPDEPINNDDPYEGNVDPSDGTISEQDPLEPKEEEDEDCECQFGECDICGLCLPGVEKRSSDGNSKSCETCPGHPTMPDCDKVGEAVDATINNFPLTLNKMREYVGGNGGCVLLYDDPSQNADGQSRYKTGEMCSDLTSAMNNRTSTNQNPSVPCAAVLVAKEGQSMFTDRQLVDFMFYSDRNNKFTTIYLVTSDNAYALRNDNVQSMNFSDYYNDLGNNGNFRSNTTGGRFVREAEGLLGNKYDNLTGMAYMCNQMDVGISVLQCTSDLTSNLLNFQKVDACKVTEIGHSEIRKTLCGE